MSGRSKGRKTQACGGVRLVVRSVGLGSAQGVLQIGNLTFPCALGRGGRRAMKVEGDGATPCGVFRLVEVLFRRDRGARPATGLPVTAIRRDDGWCDGPLDRNYNRRVRHPYPASAERLHRDDGLYDVVVVLDHNQRPRVKGRGSAVFLHVAKPGFEPTAGCVALRVRDLRLVLARAGRGARIVILA